MYRGNERPIWFFIVGLILVTIYTNPTLGDFVGYCYRQYDPVQAPKMIPEKTGYYLFFSTYTYPSIGEEPAGHYVGSYGHFYRSSGSSIPEIDREFIKIGNEMRSSK